MLFGYISFMFEFLIGWRFTLIFSLVFIKEIYALITAKNSPKCPLRRKVNAAIISKKNRLKNIGNWVPGSKFLYKR